MFPGVVVTESEDYHANEFGAGDVVSITTTASGWPLAVGTSLISSQTVLQAEGVLVFSLFFEHDQALN